MTSEVKQSWAKFHVSHMPQMSLSLGFGFSSYEKEDATHSFTPLF